MTINPDRTRELRIDQIVKAAFVMAGSLNYTQGLDNARGTWGRELLEVITKHLETQGLQVRVRDFYNLQLADGTDRYNLTDETLDVTGDAAYVPADAIDVDRASGETPVKLIDSSTWQGLSAKDATGRPTMMYPHRAGALIELRLWPIPDEAGTLRVPVQLLYPDSDDGNATPGQERPWALYLITELAHQIAESQNKTRDKIRDLERKAAGYLEKCKGFSNQRADMQVVVDHNQGY